MLPQALSMAEGRKLAGVTEEQAARFAAAIRATSYSDRSVADSFGALEMRGREGRNLPRLLYLTREPAALNTLIRIFLLGVAVPLREAAAALGPLPIQDWVDAGFVEAAGEEVRGLLRIFPFDGLLLATDPPELLEQGAGPDFVSGLTNSTAALMCCMIGKASRATLDLGTGSGVLAFLASRYSERVWATDVNPRALTMARLNARLNGLPGIEFALGSGFEPVAGRKFDRIVTNPPFILGPLNRYIFSRQRHGTGWPVPQPGPGSAAASRRGRLFPMPAPMAELAWRGLEGTLHRLAARQRLRCAGVASGQQHLGGTGGRNGGRYRRVRSGRTDATVQRVR